MVRKTCRAVTLRELRPPLGELLEWLMQPDHSSLYINNGDVTQTAAICLGHYRCGRSLVVIRSGITVYINFDINHHEDILSCS